MHRAEFGILSRMPELPEVQHAADSLGAQIVGARIASVTRLDWPPLLETPDEASFAALIAGRQVLSTGRRAKWILVQLDAGLTLAIHLRMSGYLLVMLPDAEPDKYTHLVLALDDGRQVCFHDTRKFGKVRLLDAAGVARLAERHGTEPLGDGFTPEHLRQLLAGKMRAIKPALLDQALIAGIGNIYADESLWLAKIHPLRRAGSLGEAEIDALHAGIRDALSDGLANGGSTLRDYRNARGEAGTNQEHFHAYDRDGTPCDRCGTPIAKIVVAQRGTHFCPQCQQQ